MESEDTERPTNRVQHGPASAAGNIMRELDHLTPREIVAAAPDEHEDEALAVARKVEDIVMDLDQLMYEVQEVVEDV